MGELSPDRDLDELPPGRREPGALRIVPAVADTGERVEDVVYAGHLAEGPADRRRAMEEE